jgi:ABC-2 type transport system ATP-binding protein
LSTPIIDVRELSKHFGDHKAVDQISFTVNKGEIFGFLGPNGAGKTTTINMLTGLAKPTSGSICIAGEDGIKDIKKVQQLIGIVPDESNLYDEMSGLDNLIFCASLYGLDKQRSESRAKQLLAQFGLADTGKRPFKAYSKGMKRKLTIAAGIIHQPQILFLDEPTTGIDVESARQIRHLLHELNRQGTTIFLTTHYIEEAERLCHRIGFIVKGKIVRIGRLSELMQDAQQNSIVEFTLENDNPALLNTLAKEFPQTKVTKAEHDKIRISSADRIELMPFMKFFAQNQVPVYEAKVIRPSLEDVFVKITGLELSEMKKEKEGRKK